LVDFEDERETNLKRQLRTADYRAGMCGEGA